MAFYSVEKKSCYGFADNKSDATAGFYTFDAKEKTDTMMSHAEAVKVFSTHRLVDGCLVAQSRSKTDDGNFYDVVYTETKVCDPVAVETILRHVSKK